MARFKYRMQSILDIKVKMETQAKQEFASAKIALDTEIERLEALFQRKSDYELESGNLRLGILKVREIADNKDAILRMDEYIEEQEEQVHLAEQKVEEARERLTEVIKERKTHESLKEKAFANFLLELNRQESKEIDELTSYTYGQKQQEN